jgi:hypothetical protein
MHNLRAVVSAGLAATICTGAAYASGITVLVADRTAHKIWRLTDINNDGIISPNEVFVWFDETNAAGTPGISNPVAFATRRSDNLVIVGDQGTHQYYALQDLNNDGNALGPGESRVILDSTNASGASTQTPTGIGFFPDGDILVCNSGTSTTPDAIYRLHDLDGDGRYQSAGEAAPWVVNWPGFGMGNSPYVPFETVVDSNNSGYVRSTGVDNGIYRFIDLDGNGRADDPGEFSPFFTSANASGITLSAGFALELDLQRPGAFYMLQVASGGVDQLIRVQDLNNNGNANDAGEATLVYSTGEANFASNDVLSLPGGDVLISDVTSGGKRIIRLHDINNDGLFTGPGERTDFFTAGAGPVLDTRQLALFPSPPFCGSADFNCDGSIGTDADIEAFFACLSGVCPPPPCLNGPDFNGDGAIGTDADIEAFFRVLGGGNC